MSELGCGLWAAFQGGIQDLLQLQAGRQEARAQGRFDLALLVLISIEN